LTCLVAFGEHGDTLLAACAVREHHRPSQLLVRVADVQAKVEVNLDGLVELRGGRLLEQAHCLDRRIELLPVDLAAPAAVALAGLRHSASTSTPIERAVPAMTSLACSTSRAFRSGIFVSAIDRSWARVSRPTFVRFGSPEPFSIRSASLIRTAAGGVFVMK